MIYLQGAQALDPQGYALDTLVARLQARLGQQPYLAKFLQWGGVAITKDDTKALSLVKTLSKKPFLFLEVADHEIRDRKTKGTRHELEISLEIIASDAAAPAVLELKAAVMKIIDDDYSFLHSVGVVGISIKGGQGKNTRPNRINPHTIWCAVHTPLG